ncbi:unnamed protein product [Lathyrus oleraceus]
MKSLLLVLPYFSLHLFLLLLFHFTSKSFSLCNPHDSSALLQFKNSFFVNTSSKPASSDAFDPSCSSFSFKTESWKNNTDCCKWDGVACSNVSNHVIGLDVSCNNLQGELHPNSTLFKLRHLQQLNLAFNYFSFSSLPVRIGDLVSLTHLNLSYCSLTGNIPSQISHLSKLVSLDLSNYKMELNPFTWKKFIHNATNLSELYLDYVDMSSIEGSSLSMLKNLSSSLVSLSLRFTGLQGYLSSDILTLPNLQTLDLSANDYLSGQLPKSNWSTPLRYLDLSFSNFSGEIPYSIGQLTSLTHLDLGDNKLSGLDLSENHLTGFIGNFSTHSLEYLILSNNNLHGHFPNSIFELQNLTFLHLASTNLSGVVHFHQFLTFKNLYFLNLSHNSALSINIDGKAKTLPPHFQYLSSTNSNRFPKFLAPLPNLIILDLSNNNIHGRISKWFQKKLLNSWKNIHHIDLSFNKLQGDLPIPPYGIRYLLLSNNNFTGDIALSLCNASSLQVLNLAHNNLTGKIPECLGTFPLLSILDMQMNNFYGSIPRTFCKENYFETIKLNDNQLEGPLPRSLAHCTFLEILDLGDNNIDDAFPSWLETLQELQVLSLQSNKLHGFSTELTRILTTFTTIDLSNNMFEGEIPHEIGELISLKGLNLSNNEITGNIPQSLSNLRNLEWLDLSKNQLIGEIPTSLTNLTFLSFLNLSQNHLEGIIPKGKQFDTFGNSSYDGNAMLCGFPLSKSCVNEEDQPPMSTSKDEEEESGFGWKAVATGYVCGAIFGLLFGYNVFFLGKLQWLVRFFERMFNVRLKRTHKRVGGNRR